MRIQPAADHPAIGRSRREANLLGTHLIEKVGRMCRGDDLQIGLLVKDFAKQPYQFTLGLWVKTVVEVVEEDHL